jgi:hypothetical protein
VLVDDEDGHSLHDEHEVLYENEKRATTEGIQVEER